MPPKGGMGFPDTGEAQERELLQRMLQAKGDHFAARGDGAVYGKASTRRAAAKRSFSGGHRRRLAAKRAVWPDVVVMDSPGFER